MGHQWIDDEDEMYLQRINKSRREAMTHEQERWAANDGSDGLDFYRGTLAACFLSAVGALVLWCCWQIAGVL